MKPIDWNQIIRKRYTFDYAKRVAEELSSLQEDVVNFYETYLQQSSPKRRRLAIRVWVAKLTSKKLQNRDGSLCRSLKTLKPLRCHLCSILTVVEKLWIVSEF